MTTAPIAEAGPSFAGPALFSHDPYAIHRRSFSPISKRDDDDLTAELEAVDDLTEEVSLASCSTECGVIKIQGVKSEKEALCSDAGLEATSKSRNLTHIFVDARDRRPRQR